MLISELNRFSVEELIEALPANFYFEGADGRFKLIRLNNKFFSAYFKNCYDHAILISTEHTVKDTILGLYDNLILNDIIKVKVTKDSKLKVKQLIKFLDERKQLKISACRMDDIQRG